MIRGTTQQQQMRSHEYVRHERLVDLLDNMMARLGAHAPNDSRFKLAT